METPKNGKIRRVDMSLQLAAELKRLLARRSQESFAKALGSFVEGGGTVLLVAHELGPLAPLVNRAVVIHDGLVAHDGAVPPPAGYHADPHHDHVHPHARPDQPGIWNGR